jgi:CRP-like cAMP-binding protein
MQHAIHGFVFSTQQVLAMMPQDELKQFREHLRVKKMKKGKELFKEGSYPRTVYIIKRGRVKLFQRGQSGAETIVHIHCAGEMLGYRPLLCGEKYPVTAQAIEDGVIYYLPAKQFLTFLQHSVGLSNILLRTLSQEFTLLVNKIGAFTQKSAKERIALSLLILSETYRNPKSKSDTEIALSRYDLAAFAGTTIETIARILRRFREDDVIALRGRTIIIRDKQALVRLAD